jgi:hypothetical protein
MSIEKKTRINRAGILVVMGTAGMVAGFLMIFGTSARGDNLASWLAPGLILGGLILLGSACPKEYKKNVSEHTNQTDSGSRGQ